MKNYIWTLLALIVLSCSSSRDVKVKQNYSEYKIVETPLIVENDTIYVSELRFYKVYSAIDGMKLMHQNYGEGTKKISGKHQQNIDRIVWQDVKLIEGNEETFTVITDGTETKKEYYTCIMVFDSEGRSCFQADHPYREQLIEFFAEKMNKVERSPSRNIIRIIR